MCGTGTTTAGTSMYTVPTLTTHEPFPPIPPANNGEEMLPEAQTAPLKLCGNCALRFIVVMDPGESYPGVVYGPPPLAEPRQSLGAMDQLRLASPTLHQTPVNFSGIDMVCLFLVLILPFSQ